MTDDETYEHRERASMEADRQHERDLVAQTELDTLRAMRDVFERAAAENTQGDPTEFARRVIDENSNGPIAYALAKQVIRDHQHTLLLMARSAQTVSADRVRAVVRAGAYSVIHVGTLRPFDVSQLADAIADRVAAQLTAPRPGHVCPVPYVLGPEDVDLLVDLSRMFRECGGERTSALLDKILAGAPPTTPNDQERAQLADLRRENVIDDYPAAVQYIDRLLGAKP